MPHHDSDDEVDKQGSGDRDAPSVSPDQPSSEGAQRRTDEEQNKQIEKLKRNVFVALLIAIAGPLVSLATVVFSGLQWRAATDQLSEMRRSAQLDQRAWITINPGGHIEREKPFPVKVTVRNTGKTPALITTVVAAAEPVLVGSEPRYYSRVPIDGGMTTHFNGTVLQPDTGIEFALKLTSLDEGQLVYTGKLTDKFYYGVQGGVLVIVLSGLIEYEDVFATKHWIEFCYKYSPSDQGWVACAVKNNIDQPPKP